MNCFIQSVKGIILFKIVDQTHEIRTETKLVYMHVWTLLNNNEKSGFGTVLETWKGVLSCRRMSPPRRLF